MPSNDSLAILPASYRSGLKLFLQVPHHLYADDPKWIAPLNFEEKQRFKPTRPFFEHARWQGWVALIDGRPVGRISAQIDDLHLQRYEDATGYFGMIEAIDDERVFAALFNAAETWLKDQGMRRIRGPYNLSVNEEVGLLVEGFETSPYILMGHAHRYYDDRVKAQGYSGAKDLLAYLVNPDFAAPPVMEKLVNRASRKVKVRSLRRDKLVEEAEIMRDIFNDAWQNNWGFVPFTKNEYTDLVKTLALLLSDDAVQIAECEGRPAAFIVMLPNVNEAIRDLKGKLFPFGWLKFLWRMKVRHQKSSRVPLMGVKQEFQNSPLGLVMAFMVIDAVRKGSIERGVIETEMGWILEDNKAMRNIIETIGGRAYKRYRVYEKDLD